MVPSDTPKEIAERIRRIREAFAAARSKAAVGASPTPSAASFADWEDFANIFINWVDWDDHINAEQKQAPRETATPGTSPVALRDEPSLGGGSRKARP